MFLKLRRIVYRVGQVVVDLSWVYIDSACLTLLRHRKLGRVGCGARQDLWNIEIVVDQT